MNKTSKIKISLLTMLFALAMICAFAFTGTFSAKALSASSYFEYVNAQTQVSSNIVIDEETETANIPLKNGESAKIKNDLVIDKFQIVFAIPSDVETLTITFSGDSYIVTGNPLVVEGETTYQTRIENKLVITKGEELSASWNGLTSVDFIAGEGGFETLKLTEVAEGKLSASINDIDLGASDDYYYLLDSVDKIVASVEFEVESSSQEDLMLKIKSVSQNYDDDNFNQEFALTSGSLKMASPRITLADSIFSSENKLISGKLYTVARSVHGMGTYSVSSTTFKWGKEEGSYIYNATSSSMKFYYAKSVNVDAEQATFTLGNADGSIIYDSYTFTFVDDKANGEGNAPTYVDINNGIGKVAYQSFCSALQKATKTDDGNSISVGDKQYLTLPSFRNLVVDDITSYEKMSYTVYYRRDANSANYSSSLQVPAAVVGDYMAYVVFIDENTNKMSVDDFFTIDDDNEQILNAGKYYDFVFRYTLSDDGEFSITAKESAEGFVGTKYTSAGFDIVASAYNTEYTLYYSATKLDKDSTDWVEITPTLSATDKTKTYNGLSYDEVTEIAYDGELTFTPNKIGYYMIKCQITATGSERADEECVIIDVLKTATKVQPDSHWLQENYLSVIFLSVAVLCVIGILAIIFIKPKDKTKASK